MFTLTHESAPAYLAARGIDATSIVPLGGGVSNLVLLAESAGGRFVVKQALAKLRVDEDWFSDPRRTLRECAAMQSLAALLPAGSIPGILFADEANCIYAMEAAPDGSADWKTLLLGGSISPAVARQAGEILGALIQTTWQSAEWDRRFGDQTVFDELRLDPYYRFTARRHPDLAEYFEDRIAHCGRRRVSLVHGDWSPKNLLVSDRVLAIDFEVVHYGDPSFDIAFLQNHLLLKAFLQPQWRERYAACAREFWRTASGAADASWLEESTIRHLGCLLLARIDGKSPAEYIKTPELKARIRAAARDLILHPPSTIGEIFR